MSYDNAGANLPGIVAAADYSAAQHRFVTINSAGKAALTGAGARVDAVLDNNPEADVACSLWGPGSTVKIVASAAIALGASVASDANGKAITAVSTDYVAGVAVTAAASAGALVSVWLSLPGIVRAEGTNLTGRVAAGDYSSSPYRLITINSAGKAELSGAGVLVDAVLVNSPIADAVAVLAGPGSIVTVEAGAAVAVGASIASDSIGRGVTAAESDYIVGRALTIAGAAGVDFSMWVTMPGIVENEGTRLSGIVSGADYTLAPSRLVTIASTGKAIQTAAGLEADAVLVNAPDADDACVLDGPGTQAVVESGAAFSVGDRLASDATGRVVTAAESDFIVGRALEISTGAGDFPLVWLTMPGIVENDGTRLPGVVAGADYSSAPSRFVTIDTAGKATQSTAGQVIDAVLVNSPLADAACLLDGPGTKVIVESGAAITMGDNVSSDSTGRAVTSTSGDYIGGRALEAASGAGEFMDVWFTCPGIVETP